MKLPNGQRIRWRAVWAVVIFRAHEIVWASRRRRRLAIKIARQQTVSDYICRIWWLQKPNHCRIGVTSQSLHAIQRVSANARKRPTSAPCKLPSTEIIRIRPHPSFGIIREIVSGWPGCYGPTKVASSWIVSL